MSTSSTTRAATEVLQSLGTSRKRLKTADDVSNVIDLTGPDDPSRIILNVDSDDNDDDDDEVEIVDPPPQVKTDHAQNNTNDDDDVQVMGTVNALQLPHMRCHCTEHPFVENHKENNSHSCDLCYCYVCDVPVKDCTEWKASASHCNATDKDLHWNSLRQNKQASKPTASILEARLIHGKLFKNIFQTVGKFVNQVCLECVPGYGMTCNVMSNDTTTMVSWELKTNAFDMFQCNEKVLLHVNVSHVNEVLKAVKHKSRVVVLKATSSFLTISVEDKATGEVVSDPSRVSLCRNLHYVPLARPSHDHKCDATIPSAEFKRIVGLLWSVGSTTRFSPTCIIAPLSGGPNSISFSLPDNSSAPKGYVSKCRYTLKTGNVGVLMNDSGSFEVRFATRLLYQLTRPPPLSPNVFLALSPGQPMEIEYPLEDPKDEIRLGRFSLIVAPHFSDSAD